MAKAKDKAAEETTAMTTTSTTAVEVFDYDDAVDVGDDAVGYEGQTSEDTALPFIKFVQSGTPELKKKLVPGLEEGDILNPVTGRVWKNPQGLIWISAMTRHEYIRYKHLDVGGGFLGRFAIDSQEVAKAKAESTKFGQYFIGPEYQGEKGMVRDELAEHFYSFGVFCDEEVNPLGVGILAFKSTGIKCYKSWMSAIRGHTVLGTDGRKKIPPMYSHINRFTTMYREEGKKAWYVPIYSPAIEGDLNKSMLKKDHPAFMMARQVYESVQADAVKVDYNKMRDTDEEAAGAQAGGQSAF